MLVSFLVPSVQSLATQPSSEGGSWLQISLLSSQRGSWEPSASLSGGSWGSARLGGGEGGAREGLGGRRGGGQRFKWRRIF